MRSLIDLIAANLFPLSRRQRLMVHCHRRYSYNTYAHMKLQQLYFALYINVNESDYDDDDDDDDDEDDYLSLPLLLSFSLFRLAINPSGEGSTTRVLLLDSARSSVSTLHRRESQLLQIVLNDYAPALQGNILTLKSVCPSGSVIPKIMGGGHCPISPSSRSPFSPFSDTEKNDFHIGLGYI